MLNSFFSNSSAYFKPSDYDSSDWAKSVGTSTNPFTSAGTFSTVPGINPQGPYGQIPMHVTGPGTFTPNALGQKALDAIKTDTGISIAPQWAPPDRPGEQGKYTPKDSGNTVNSRIVNFTSDAPNINVLLHESGHALDPNLETGAYGPSFNLADYKQQSTPVGQLNYAWQHAGFPSVQAETEAQRFARGYAYQLSPALGHAMIADPWYKGYPKSYGDETVQNVYNENAPISDKTISRFAKQSGGQGADYRDGMPVGWDGKPFISKDARTVLNMALDPKFQQTQKNILQQTNDYVDRTLN